MKKKAKKKTEYISIKITTTTLTKRYKKYKKAQNQTKKKWENLQRSLAIWVRKAKDIKQRTSRLETNSKKKNKKNDKDQLSMTKYWKRERKYISM